MGRGHEICEEDVPISQQVDTLQPRYLKGTMSVTFEGRLHKTTLAYLEVAKSNSKSPGTKGGWSRTRKMGAPPHGIRPEKSSKMGIFPFLEVGAPTM